MRTMEVHGTVEQNHRLNKNCCSGQTSGIALIIAEVVVIYIDDPAQLMEDSKVNHVKDYDAHVHSCDTCGPWFNIPSQLLFAAIGILITSDHVAALHGHRLSVVDVIFHSVGATTSHLKFSVEMQ